MTELKAVAQLMIGLRASSPTFCDLDFEFPGIVSGWVRYFIMANSPPRQSYFVIVTRRGQVLHRWGWEIRRKPTPLGIRIYGEDFESAEAAQIAGNAALKDLLDRINNEADS